MCYVRWNNGIDWVLQLYNPVGAMASPDRRLPKIKSTAKADCSPDGNNSHESVTKVNLRVERHRQWFDFKRDGVRQKDTLRLNE